MSIKRLASKNDHFHLWMQKDGNLELHKKLHNNHRGNWEVIWASRTTGAGRPPYRLDLNENTNELEIHDSYDNFVWKSSVSVSNRNNFVNGGYAILENNGNFVVYDGKNTTMWSTGTKGGHKSPAFGSGIKHEGRFN